VLFLTRLLVLILPLRLFLPSGICLCHFFDRQQVLPALPEESPFDPGEEDHVPSCPCSKTTCDWVCQPALDLPDADLSCSLIDLSPAVDTWAGPAHPVLTRYCPPPDQPVFLTVRALLI
jgi:hypothetical protein